MPQRILRIVSLYSPRSALHAAQSRLNSVPCKNQGPGMTTQRTVFRDESVLFPEHVPHTIPHRMDQIRTLEFYFQSVVEKSPQASQNVLLYGPVGCHRKGQLVLMFDGSLKRVEDVSRGDLLMGPDSAPRKVLETVHGFGKMVEVQRSEEHTSELQSRLH